MLRKPGVGKMSKVAAVQKSVVDAWGKRIEFFAISDQRIVRGPSLFGEVVDLEDKPLTRFGQVGDDFWKQTIFSQRVIVEMPNVGRTAEGFGRGGAETVG